MPGPLHALDWLVVVAYVAALLLLARRLGRGQEDAGDYFLAGRAAGPWAVAVSVTATQAGAVSLIGAPAFVALRQGGGLTWLQYELAVPVAMMVLLVTLVPFFHARGVVTVYEYLEERFDRRTRTVVSVAFQVSRVLATGVGIFALALVLSAVLAWPLAPTILLIGGVTLVYDVIGGMRAVIASDVVQMLVMGAGVLAAMGVLVATTPGGWAALTAAVDPARAVTLDASRTGFAGGGDFALAPMLVGGLFLYVAYYGVDQSQAQRFQCARDPDAARKAVFLAGVLRFPFVVAYCALGFLLAGYVALTPAFADLVPASRPDYLVPLFIVHVLPTGLTGLLVAAILAAAMSSLDSALNSLSAATMRDVVEPFFPRVLEGRSYLAVARGVTIAWGVVATAFAFSVGGISPTVIEAVNKVGSVFYGPLLGVFALAVLTRRATGRGVLVGLATGLAANGALAVAAPGVSWLWWNPFGFAVTLLAGYAWSRATRTPANASAHGTWRRPGVGWALPGRFGAAYLALSVFFAIALFLVARAGRLAA